MSRVQSKGECEAAIRAAANTAVAFFGFREAQAMLRKVQTEISDAEWKG